MELSRIYVKNLPPTITEPEFRKHFASQRGGGIITDVRLMPKRRIGFVGYKAPEDARKAVKYFNRSFIRLSKISVELARSIADPSVVRAEASSTNAAAAPNSAEPARTVRGDDARKRKHDAVDAAGPKLQEFLDVMDPGRAAKRLRDDCGAAVQPENNLGAAVVEAGESDDEYEDLPPARPHDTFSQPTEAQPGNDGGQRPEKDDSGPPAQQDLALPTRQVPIVPADATDDDWLRNRTRRDLDLVDPDDPSCSPAVPPISSVLPTEKKKLEEPVIDDAQDQPQGKTGPTEPPANELVPVVGGNDMELVKRTCRLFVRNLPYSCSEDELRDHFGQYGTLEEVNIRKGFAFLRYDKASSAVDAFQADGSTFQGRLLHVLPGKRARELKLDEIAISKLPLKKQKMIRKKTEAASNTFNWNALFMDQNAVTTAMAERLGVSKHELLDPTDASAAVRQAIAETTVINEAREYFAANGVILDSFKSRERGDTAILVKNIPPTTVKELRALFEEHGTVLRVLMPPSATIAIVEFAQASQCRAAFAKKAYSRFKESVLFLEKAPKSLFVAKVAPPQDEPPASQRTSAADLLDREDAEDCLTTTSLFIRNLNFSTTNNQLKEAFEPLPGLVGSQIKTKTDPKKPGQVLSMGYGFVHFRTKDQAVAAQKIMDGYVLDGKTLAVKVSHKGLDAAEERRRDDLAKKAAGTSSKLVIKNLPFQATKADVRSLFGTYGTVRSVRVPKKFDDTSRGFAFAEFATSADAAAALKALKDTHLLGRRLVIAYAEADETDPEEHIQAMENKMREQANVVALHQLTGKGRTKVNIGDQGDGMDEGEG